MSSKSDQGQGCLGPSLLILLFGFIYFGMRLSEASSQRGRAAERATVVSPSPTPSNTPLAVSPVATPQPQSPATVVTGSRTFTPVWVKVQLVNPVFSEAESGLTPTGCQPGFSEPDGTGQRKICLPDGMHVIATSQQQNGMTACKCWFPGLPNVDPPSEEQYNICKGPTDAGIFWINSQALVR